MVEDWSFQDDLGPAKILRIYEPTLGLKAVVVVDNVAAGPAIGGLRMVADVSTEECFRLARAMTLKNAAAGLAHGGGKSVLFADPQTSQKEDLIRAFAQAIRSLEDYIPGPDMGTDEGCMAWINDEIGRAVGLPPELGGIPLDKIGATGFGLCVAGEVAQEFCDLRLDGARIAVQGFGAVGINAARFLVEKGAVLVAASDSRGFALNPSGLDVEELCQLKRSGGSLADHRDGQKEPREAIVGVDCDVFIPAARPDAIHRGNAGELKAKLVLEGANIPIAPGTETLLHERGILCVPDFIANAGGVISAAVEYHGGGQNLAFETITEKLSANTESVLKESRARKIAPRQAATEMAHRRVLQAMSYRRWFGKPAEGLSSNN